MSRGGSRIAALGKRRDMRHHHKEPPPSWLLGGRGIGSGSSDDPNGKLDEAIERTFAGERAMTLLS
jgi:hypothetical protein